MAAFYQPGRAASAKESYRRLCRPPALMRPRRPRARTQRTASRGWRSAQVPAASSAAETRARRRVSCHKRRWRALHVNMKLYGTLMNTYRSVSLASGSKSCGARWRKGGAEGSAVQRRSAGALQRRLRRSAHRGHAQLGGWRPRRRRKQAPGEVDLRITKSAFTVRASRGRGCRARAPAAPQRRTSRAARDATHRRRFRALLLPAALGRDLRAERRGAKQPAQLRVSLRLQREAAVKVGDGFDRRHRRDGGAAGGWRSAAATPKRKRRGARLRGKRGVRRAAQCARLRRVARAERGGGRSGGGGRRGGAAGGGVRPRLLRRVHAGGQHCGGRSAAV